MYKQDKNKEMIKNRLNLTYSPVSIEIYTGEYPRSMVNVYIIRVSKTINIHLHIRVIFGYTTIYYTYIYLLITYNYRSITLPKSYRRHCVYVQYFSINRLKMGACTCDDYYSTISIPTNLPSLIIYKAV